MNFGPTGGMATVRESHTATLLRNGKVLITGGNDGYTAIATAELFDPTTGRFGPAGSMASARSYQTATLLKDGKVLVAGGRDTLGNILATAELFDPGTGKFTPAGSMRSAREFHTATLLPDGKVLITGGENEGATLSTAEFFDPATENFTPVGNMSSARKLHTATLRQDGSVLLVGGAEVPEESRQNTLASAHPRSLLTAELFDPSTGKFTPTSPMSYPRAKHTATLLPDGTIIVVGGTLSENPAPSEFLASAELFQ
jgi:WD40 repeat protein